MVVEWIVGPIVVKGVEMIINYLTKNPDARESSELAELRSQVEFLKRNLGQQITEDEFWRVQKALEEIYPLIDEYDIDIPDIEYELDCDECVACGICEEVCPTEAIILNYEGIIEDIDLDKCIDCGLCAEECPVEAIKIFIPVVIENHLASAEIKDIWVEHDVWEEDSKGMRIHVSFDINNLEGVICRAVAYFYFESGKPIRDFNQRYCTTDGKVSSGIDLEPRYVNTAFNDLCIFLPYDELHIRKPGKYDLKFYVSIWYENTELDRSRWESFIYTIY